MPVSNQVLCPQMKPNPSGGSKSKATVSLSPANHIASQAQPSYILAIVLGGLIPKRLQCGGPKHTLLPTHVMGPNQ